MLVASVCFTMQLEASYKTDGKAVYTELQGKQKAEKVNKTAYWNEMADGMVQALINHFWGANFEGYPDRYYFKMIIRSYS